MSFSGFVPAWRHHPEENAQPKGSLFAYIFFPWATSTLRLGRLLLVVIAMMLLVVVAVVAEVLLIIAEVPI